MYLIVMKFLFLLWHKFIFVNLFFYVMLCFSDVNLSKFALEDIIGKEGENLLLNASEGTEFDKDITSKASSTEEQKKRLNAEMGLDVASKLGICEDLVNNEDLQGIRSQNGFLKSQIQQAFIDTKLWCLKSFAKEI